MNKGNQLRLGAAITAMALAGLAFASPGLAHDPDGKGEGKRVEKVIIIGDHADGDHAGAPGDGRVRTFNLHRMDMADCRGGDRTVRESNENGQRTKVIICRRGDGPHAGAARGAGPRVRAFAMEGGDLADCLGGQRNIEESNEGGRHSHVVICRRGDGPHAGPGRPGGPPRIRAFAMNGGELEDCLGGERNVTESNENGQHSRVILCNRGDASPAQRIERLERVLGRLNSGDQLTAEQKERVTAALREAIERLRTAP